MADDIAAFDVLLLFALGLELGPVEGDEVGWFDLVPVFDKLQVGHVRPVVLKIESGVDAHRLHRQTGNLSRCACI